VEVRSPRTQVGTETEAELFLGHDHFKDIMVLGQVLLLIGNADIWDALAPICINFGNVSTRVSKTCRVTIIPSLRNMALSALRSGNKTELLLPFASLYGFQMLLYSFTYLDVDLLKRVSRHSCASRRVRSWLLRV